MNKLFRAIGRRFGRHVGKKAERRSNFRSAFQNAVLCLFSSYNSIRIVQVGANDGKINDPIYDFVMNFAARTEVLLIEPQPLLIPYLVANYADHPAHKIFNGAIDPIGTLKLYAIDPAWWDKLSPSYGKEWPTYRAPTGITSTSRKKVEAWLEAHAKAGVDLANAIQTQHVTCMPLFPLLKEMGFSNQIDVLQIDAEGFDDEVIYNSSIEVILPRIIHFESSALSGQKYSRLKEFLAQNIYILSRQGPNSLAILVRQKYADSEEQIKT